MLHWSIKLLLLLLYLLSTCTYFPTHRSKARYAQHSTKQTDEREKRRASEGTHGGGAQYCASTTEPCTCFLCSQCFKIYTNIVYTNIVQAWIGGCSTSWYRQRGLVEVYTPGDLLPTSCFGSPLTCIVGWHPPWTRRDRHVIVSRYIAVIVYIARCGCVWALVHLDRMERQYDGRSCVLGDGKSASCLNESLTWTVKLLMWA